MNLKFRKKKDNKKEPKNNSLIDNVESHGFSYLGDTLSDCGKIKFTYKTMYKIQRKNTEAQQSKNKVVKMIGKRGIQMMRGKEYIEDNIWANKIQSLMTDPLNGDFISTKDSYYTNHFCSGMVFGYIAKNGLGEPVIQILDSRNITQKFDDYGNIKEISYGNKKLNIDRVIKQITQYDPDRPGYGMSAYESVVYDAMSDLEASKRNFYFFKNNAMPSVILTMDRSIDNPEEVNAAIKQFENKYKGSEKSHGVLATGGIKEVRTIDFSNKDLELLELKKFAIKKMGVVFGFDPRFLGYKDDKNGSHSEYQIMANQSDKAMTDFADIFENFILKAIRKVYALSFPYTGINLVNDEFLDKIVRQEMVEKKVEKGLCTLKQGIHELGYSVKGLPKYMDTYMINTQWNSVENILGTSEKNQELMDKQIKEDQKDKNTDDEKDDKKAKKDDKKGKK